MPSFPRRIPIRTGPRALSPITHTRLSSQLTTSLYPSSPTSTSTSTSTSTTPISHPNEPTTSTNHHDLPTFLTHATRTNLPPTSTLFIGTHYEYVTQRSLARYGLHLTRIGGRSDHGIDLIGHWRLPRSIVPEPLKVLVQCKALQRRRPGPHLVRELEGACTGAGYTAHALGVLCAPREATKGVREALGRSRLPLAFVMVEAQRAGGVAQFLWNRAAAEVGLGELGVTLRYRACEGEGEEGVRGEVALTWRGEVIRDLGVDVDVDRREEQHEEG